MPKWWKVKAWIHDKVSALFGLAVVVALLYGLWYCRDLIFGILG